MGDYLLQGIKFSTHKHVYTQLCYCSSPILLFYEYIVENKKDPLFVLFLGVSLLRAENNDIHVPDFAIPHRGAIFLDSYTCSNLHYMLYLHVKYVPLWEYFSNKTWVKAIAKVPLSWSSLSTFHPPIFLWDMPLRVMLNLGLLFEGVSWK